MKNFFLIIFFSISIGSQYHLSLYGAGDKVAISNPSKISLGWSYLFSSNDYLKSGSLSNFYLSDLVRLSMSTDFNFSFINSSNYYNQKINYFNFLIPLKKNELGLGFSLSPYYRVNSNIIQSDYSYLPSVGLDYNAKAYRSEYSFSGGPSVASLLISSKINSKLSFGFKFNYIFGSLYSHIQNITYNINYFDYSGEPSYSEDSNNQYTSIANYSGYGFKIETSYHNKGNILITSFGLLGQTKINDYFYDDISPGALEIGVNYNQETIYEMSSPFEFNIAYSKTYKENSFILEYYLYRPFESDISILDNPDLNKDKFNFGYHKHFLNRKITLGTGFYVNNSYNDMIKSLKKGFTIGLGVNLIKYFSADFCLEFGDNKVEFPAELDEKYINLYIGLSSSDKWFK